MTDHHEPLKEMSQASREPRFSISENEDIFHIAFENAGVGMMITDPKGTLLEVNNEICSILGYSKDDILKKTIPDLSHPEDLITGDYQIHADGSERQSLLRNEKRFMHREGYPVWAEVSSVLIRKESGEPRFHIIHIKDISERKKAERDFEVIYEQIKTTEEELWIQYSENREKTDALLKSEWKFRNLVETLQEGIWATDLDAHTSFVNQRMADMLGYTIEELQGRSLFEFINAQDRTVEILSNKSLKSGLREQYDCDLVRKDGHKISVFLTISILTDRVGSCTGILASVIDITDRKRMEEELIFNSTILSIEQEVSPDGILVVDEHGLVISCNQRFNDIWEIPEKISSAGQDHLTMISVLNKLQDPDEYLGNIRYLYDHREEKSCDEILLIDGRILEQYSSPMYRDENRYIGRVWTFHDITFQKKTEQEIRRLNQDLEERVEERTIALQQNLEKLGRKEQELLVRNEEMILLHEDLTAAHEDLVENFGKLAKVDLALKEANEHLEQRVTERTAQLKKAMYDAGAERQRLYDVLETLPVYVCLLDADYHMPFSNKYFRDCFGESDGRCCYDILFNLAEPCENCETYQVLKSGAPTHWQWTGPNDRDYDVYDYPFTDTNGSFMILEMGIDITETNRAKALLRESYDALEVRVEERTSELQQVNNELYATNEELTALEEELRVQIEVTNIAYEALERSEERFRISAQSVSDVIWDWDLMKDRLDWYGRIDEMLGYDHGEFPHSIDAWKHIIHPDDRERILNELDRHITMHMPYETEYRILKKDGTIRFWIDRGTAMYDENGRVYRMVGSCTDITERRLAEEAVRASEERYRFLFEASPVGIFLTVQDGTVIDANRTVQEITGYSGDEFKNMNMLSLYSDPDARVQLIKEVLKTGFIRDFDVQMHRKDGTLYDALLNVDLIQGGGQPVLLTTLRDITQQKKMTALIEASLTEKETLLREIHHRVKNNLQIITSLLNLQIRKIDNPKTVDALRDSQNRVKTMAMVHEHLYQSKNISHIDLGMFISSLVNMLFQSYQQDGKKITHEINCNNIMVDINTAIPLGLITNELIINSLKYAFPENHSGKLSITTSESQDDLTLVISDNGVGIGSGNIDSTESLGLRLVHTLTDQLDGSIQVEGLNGTTFTFVFPKSTKTNGKER